MFGRRMRKVSDSRAATGKIFLTTMRNMDYLPSNNFYCDKWLICNNNVNTEKVLRTNNTSMFIVLIYLIVFIMFDSSVNSYDFINNVNKETTNGNILISNSNYRFHNLVDSYKFLRNIEKTKSIENNFHKLNVKSFENISKRDSQYGSQVLNNYKLDNTYNSSAPVILPKELSAHIRNNDRHTIKESVLHQHKYYTDSSLSRRKRGYVGAYNISASTTMVTYFPLTNITKHKDKRASSKKVATENKYNTNELEEASRKNSFGLTSKNTLNATPHRQRKTRLLDTKPTLRINVVEENPTLDVGPLIHIRVLSGQTARLPCTFRTMYSNDSARLVLWYRNDTSKPILSFDGRGEQDDPNSNEQNLLYMHYQHHHPDSEVPGSVRKITMKDKLWNNEDSSSKRISLDSEGQTLIIKYVQKEDQAEYRCTVHYKRAPSATERMQLHVLDHIPGMRVVDSGGRTVTSTIGPFSEGHQLLLSCTTNYVGELKSLEWLVNGEPIASSWASPREGTATTHLDMVLQSEHDYNDLVCRLTTVSQHQSSFPRDQRLDQRRNKMKPISKVNNGRTKLETSITDISILIQMYSVPEARLTVIDSDTRSLTMSYQSGVEVDEGEQITFKCSVKSRPPPYNITFMINGKVSPNTRGARDTLRIHSVSRRDAGLYTCLASNTEGDGHSNAIFLKVKHVPYCKGEANKKLVVARNTSITLNCPVDAQPLVSSYNWVKGDPVISPTSMRPDKEFEKPSLGTGATITLIPSSDLTQLVCYAKNTMGYSLIPCVYDLVIVDPPTAPKNCRVIVESPTRLDILCLPDHPSTPSVTFNQSDVHPSNGSFEKELPSESNRFLKDSQMEVNVSHSSDVQGKREKERQFYNENKLRPSPGQLGFVRSSEAMPVTRLEVWNEDGKLLVNTSNKSPRFSLKGLPPSSDLTLRIYSASKEILSPPVVLYAKTKPWPVSKTREEPTDAEVAQESPTPSQPMSIFILAAAIGAALSLLALIFVLAAIVVLLLRKKRRRQNNRTNITTDIGEERRVSETKFDVMSRSEETVTLEERDFWIRPGLQMTDSNNSLNESTKTPLNERKESSGISVLPDIQPLTTSPLPPMSILPIASSLSVLPNYSTSGAMPSVSLDIKNLPAICTIPSSIATLSRGTGRFSTTLPSVSGTQVSTLPRHWPQ